MECDYSNQMLEYARTGDLQNIRRLLEQRTKFGKEKTIEAMVGDTEDWLHKQHLNRLVILLPKLVIFAVTISIDSAKKDILRNLPNCTYNW